jgi:hypothetical protein
MQENRFFRFVWRVNGIAILLLVVSAVVIDGYQLVTSPVGSAKASVITNIADDPGNKERWHLGQVTAIPETPYLFIPLVSEHKNIEASRPFLFHRMRFCLRDGYYEASRSLS